MPWRELHEEAIAAEGCVKILKFDAMGNVEYHTCHHFQRHHLGLLSLCRRVVNTNSKFLFVSGEKSFLVV
jgi:hypothetical protein